MNLKIKKDQSGTDKNNFLNVRLGLGFKPKLSKKNKAIRAEQEKARAALMWRPSKNNNFIVRANHEQRRLERRRFERLMRKALFIRYRNFVKKKLLELFGDADFYQFRGYLAKTNEQGLLEPSMNKINRWANRPKEAARFFGFTLPNRKELGV